MSGQTGRNTPPVIKSAPCFLAVKFAKFFCAVFVAGCIIRKFASGKSIFMAITLKRQLTPEEKNIILQRHGRICFATGHAIPEEESLHYLLGASE
jgi:hypothetical protein